MSWEYILNGAAGQGDVEMIKKALSEGANINEPVLQGDRIEFALISALSSDCKKSRKLKVVEVLLGAGANSNVTGTSGNPLYWAASLKDAHLVTMLIDR